MILSPREAAYFALLFSLKQENYVAKSLENWQQRDKPSALDFAFAYEIAAGSARMALALDYIALQLTTNKKLSLKLKERALLRTAIYQHCFMDRVPLYAIVDESIKIAKKYCHVSFANFLNALLRKLSDNTPSLPLGNTADDLSIRLSYPVYFVKALVDDYGMEQAVDLLEIGNKPQAILVRIRPGMNQEDSAYKHLKLFDSNNISLGMIENASQLSGVASSPNLYIQNATPAVLISELAQKSNLTHPQSCPKRILDLCASPGGKLLAAHDAFPEASLFANDVSQEKLLQLSKNLAKYQIEANLSCGPGEEYPEGDPFDIVILDVPCSNSGVLHKRPEARWRLNPESIKSLKKTQLKLLEHASTLINKDGVIWYLTCSILKDENEGLISEFCSRHAMEVVWSRTILPNNDGWDGGYGCLLKANQML